LSNVHNWKSPGSDQIHNNWLKAFSAAHKHITKNINAVIQELQKVCDWLTTGIITTIIIIMVVVTATIIR